VRVKPSPDELVMSVIRYGRTMSRFCFTEPGATPVDLALCSWLTVSVTPKIRQDRVMLEP
jgi:hypothetical protein